MKKTKPSLLLKPKNLLQDDLFEQVSSSDLFEEENETREQDIVKNNENSKDLKNYKDMFLNDLFVEDLEEDYDPFAELIENEKQEENDFQSSKVSKASIIKNFRENNRKFKEERIESIEDEEINNQVYQEYEVVIDKIIYTDSYNGYAAFTATPKTRKAIYAYVDGKKERQYGIKAVLKNDMEAHSLLNVGANLMLLGKWENEETYGIQFSCLDISNVLIENDRDLEKFLLKNGLVNVNEKIARLIVQKSKQDKILIKNLLENPLSLNEIDEIKNKSFLAKNIAIEWFNYQQSFFFAENLVSYGLKRGMARKIYKHLWFKYTDEVPEIKEILKLHIKDWMFKMPMDIHSKFHSIFIENPYVFMDVKGVGFKSLDVVALNLGIALDDERRVEALIKHVINEECESKGHTLIELEQLRKKMNSMPHMNNDLVVKMLKESLSKKTLIIRKMDLGEGEKKYITTDQLFIAEYITGKKIQELSEYQFNLNEEAIKEIDDPSFNNDVSQSNAVKMAYQNSISIITGGPGCGKTHTLKKAIYIFNKYEKRKEIILLAPTGKAAKRMEEVINSDSNLKELKLKSSTIHKLLYGDEFKNNGEMATFYNEHIFLIDESSMIDSRLMFSLIKRIGVGSRIVFVGDIDQIPPVGIGQVMRDLINSKKIPIAKLTTIHRTNEDSLIPENAKLINEGKVPRSFGNYKTDDFSFIPCQDDLTTFSYVEEVLLHLLESGVKKKDIQIVTPQYSGLLGVNELNSHLKWLLNEDFKDKKEKLEEQYRKRLRDKKTNKSVDKNFVEGDRVINKKNNYDLNIFNGEIGIVKDPLGDDGFTFFNEDESKIVNIDKKTKSQFDLAYAITVHKAQGSEAPIIIMPVVKAHSFTLNKFLLYTGITRAKEKVILIGNEQTLYATVNKNKQGNRLTSLIYEMEHWQDHQEVYDIIVNNKNYVGLEALEDE